VEKRDKRKKKKEKKERKEIKDREGGFKEDGQRINCKLNFLNHMIINADNNNTHTHINLRIQN
jgi:hypothetical protein